MVGYLGRRMIAYYSRPCYSRGPRQRSSDTHSTPPRSSVSNSNGSTTSGKSAPLPPFTYSDLPGDRYTTFLPLYPLGASSEAFLAFSTLPPLSTLPHIPSFSPGMSILKHLPTSVGKAALRSKMGRNLLWRIARASAARQVSARVGVRAWGWLEILRLVLFLVWWPCEWSVGGVGAGLMGDGG